MISGCWRLALIGTLAGPAALSAQGGGIAGRVVEVGTGRPLGGARVQVGGSDSVAITRVDGYYRLTGVAAGAATLRVALIGYGPKSVTGITVPAGGVAVQDIVLEAQATRLEEVVVTAVAEQGSVDAALATQRQSIAIVNAISAEELRRSPDGDAAAALQRMSGATVREGKYLNLRGLGDRYTHASLNGARIPSPEPERKLVPLDLFPAALLGEITAAKTFTPDQSGDFSGGAVNIRTREFPAERYFAVSVSAGLNDAAAGRSGFAPATSRDWLALGSLPRALPAPLAETDFTRPLPAAESNSLVNSLRNVWSPRERGGSPNGGLGISAAGTLPAGRSGLSYLVTGTYSYAQEVRAGEQRALAQPPSRAGGEVTELDRFDGSTGRSTVLWGGIANFGLAAGSRTKLTLNSTYNRTMDNEGRRESGWSENLSLPLEIRRLRYVERSVYSSQLEAYHQAGSRHFLDAAVTVSGVTRKEPDRSEVVYESSTGTPSWYGFSNEAAVRTFGDLAERSLEGTANWRFRLGQQARNRFLQAGVLYRTTHRDARNIAYSIALLRPLSESERTLAPEELFDGRLTSGDREMVHIVPLGAGGSYEASDRIAAGYLMATLELSPSLELIGGARLERSTVTVSSRSTAGEPSLATPGYTDLLPSLALTWRPNRTMNLRVSATQTLSRPEYRELSPILFREVIGGDNVKGNPELSRALVRNADVRWEWYPRGGAVLSAAVFAKWFQDPIERIYQGTSGTRIITYVNARGAENVGIELEARRSLDLLAPGLRSVSGFANLTMMRSRIRLNTASGSLTNPERKMVGQAPYVLNGGLTWKDPASPASVTVLFNRVGARITEAGEIPLPDVIEQPRNMLDAAVALPLFGTLAARLEGKNLLDSPWRLTQGGVVREGYRAGRVFSVGFSWKH